MEKRIAPSEEEDDEEEKPIETTKDEVQIVKIATSVEEQFKTPLGVMNTIEYLAWMGNILLKIRKGVIGK